MEDSLLRLADPALAAKFQRLLTAEPGRSLTWALQLLRKLVGLKKRSRFTSGLLSLLSAPDFLVADVREYVETHQELAWRLSNYGAFGGPLFEYLSPGYSALDSVHQACVRARILATVVSSGFGVRSGARAVVRPSSDAEREEVKRLRCSSDAEASVLYSALRTAAQRVSPFAVENTRIRSPWVPDFVLEPLLKHAVSRGVSAFFVPAFCPTLEDVLTLGIFEDDFKDAVAHCRQNFLATVFPDSMCTMEESNEAWVVFRNAMRLADQGTEHVDGTRRLPDTLVEPCAQAAELASLANPVASDIASAIERACEAAAAESKESPDCLPERDDLAPFARLMIDALVKRQAAAMKIDLVSVERLTPMHVAMFMGYHSPLYVHKLLVEDEEEETGRVKRFCHDRQ